jgi:hypothetical protein
MHEKRQAGVGKYADNNGNQAKRNQVKIFGVLPRHETQ